MSDNVDLDQTPQNAGLSVRKLKTEKSEVRKLKTVLCTVTSDLGLHCLPMSLLWDARFKRDNIASD